MSAALSLTTFAACAETESRGRGLLEGQNAVLALSLIFVLSAVGIVVVLIGIDRFLQSRRRLAELGATPAPEPGEQDEEIVAGIRVANSKVPRWLYAAYLVLPLFAIGYVMNAADLAPPPPAETPEGPETPTGPATEITLVAEGLKFNTERIVAAADSEITLTLDNNDPVPHDFALYTDETMTETLYHSEQITNDTRNFTFTSPPVGTYHFHCTIHPDMEGEFVTEEPVAEEEGPVTVTADKLAFDTDEIRLPANTEVELTLVNAESLSHNIAIYTTDAATEPIFEGGFITNDQVVYSFTTPDPGEYYFRCDAHPSMEGTVIVS